MTDDWAGFDSTRVIRCAGRIDRVGAIVGGSSTDESIRTIGVSVKVIEPLDGTNADVWEEDEADEDESDVKRTGVD